MTNDLTFLNNLKKQFRVIENGLLKAKSEGKKTMTMDELGEDEYAKNMSNCCDALLMADKEHCSKCGEGCTNQVGE